MVAGFSFAFALAFAFCVPMFLLRFTEALGALLLVSELALAFSRRSAKSGATAAAGGSHRFLWLIISVAIFVAWLCAIKGLGPRFSDRQLETLAATATLVFAVGSALRWWSIVHLGRFFTVDVATTADQRVVQDGPYRWVRHPSYTGLLLQFAGWALTFNHVLSWLIILVPVTAALVVRIRREEAVLREHLGAAYAAYCARTRRLIPGMY